MIYRKAENKLISIDDERPETVISRMLIKRTMSSGCFGGHSLAPYKNASLLQKIRDLGLTRIEDAFGIRT